MPAAVVPPDLLAAVDLDDPDFDFIVDSIRHLRAAGLDTTSPDVLRLAVAGARNSRDRFPGRIDALRADPQSPQVDLETTAWVYYARLSNRVKIGFSSNVPRRLVEVGAEELLACERGGPYLESRRHEQFAAFRSHSEWFRLEGALADHIARLPTVHQFKPTASRTNRFRRQPPA